MEIVLNRSKRLNLIYEKKEKREKKIRGGRKSVLWRVINLSEIVDFIYFQFDDWELGGRVVVIICMGFFD